MKLSILILTTNKRVMHEKLFFNSIVEKLTSQIDKINGNSDIELLGLMDNYAMTIGEKRNILLSIAKGDYIVFIDDDDTVSDNYIEKVMYAINNTNADVITYNSLCFVQHKKLMESNFNHGIKLSCTYKLDVEYTALTPWSEEYFKSVPYRNETWVGLPAHTHLWKSTLAKKYKFEHINTGEDFKWIALLCKEAKTQFNIDEFLYTYNAVVGKDY